MSRSSDLSSANILRQKFDELIQKHENYSALLQSICTEIESIHISTLEALYLVEYVKTRHNNSMKKESIEPSTLKTINTLEANLKTIERSLKDLNLKVDLEWDEYTKRKRYTKEPTQRKKSLNSLELIYKTLVMNQKIINVYKQKVNVKTKKDIEYDSRNSNKSLNISQKNFSTFRDYLETRTTVPIRKPLPLLIKQ